MDGEEKFRPSKYMPAFDESRSLKFDGAERKRLQRAAQRGEDYMDSMLKNIRDLIDAKSLKLENFSPEIIQHINNFEHLNDFDKTPEFYAQEKAKLQKRKRRKSARQQADNPNSVLNQFGFTSSG